MKKILMAALIALSPAVLCGPAPGAGVPDEKEIGSLIQALSDDAKREAAQDKLWEIGPPAAGALRRALFEREAKTRESAAQILGRMRAADAADDLARALEDPESKVRVAAALALSEIAEKRTLGALARAARHEDERTRAAAAFALGHIRDDLSLMVLAGLARDDSGEVRSQAATAMGLLGDVRIASILAWMALKDPYAEARALAAGALGDLKAEGAALALAGALGDEETVVANYAARALRTLTGKDFGFSAHGTQEEKEEARRKWLAYLEADRKRFGAIPQSRDGALEKLAEERLSGDEGVTALSGEERTTEETGRTSARTLYNLAAAQHQLGNLSEAMVLYQQALEQDKRLAQAHAGMGLILLAEGAADAAVKHLEQARKLEPTNALIEGNLARGYLAVGEDGKALESARRAWSGSRPAVAEPADAGRARAYLAGIALAAGLDTSDLAFADEVVREAGSARAAVAGRSLYGAFLFACGEERSAWKELEAARQSGALEEHGMIALGRALLRSGKKAEACALAVGLVGKASARTTAECADILLAAGRLEDARTVLLTLAGDPVRNSAVERERAILAAASGNAREAQGIALRLLSTPRSRGDARTLALLADTFAQLGDANSAGIYYRQALSLNAGLEEAIRGLATLALSRDGQPEAIRVLKEGLDGSPRRNTRLLAMLARAYSAAGMDREAGEVATVAVVENLEAGPLYLLAAYSWEGTGEDGLALDALRKYAREIPGSRSFSALARFLATCEKTELRSVQEAVFFARLAVEQAEDTESLEDAATALRRSGDIDGAIEALGKALLIKPNDPRLTESLVSCLREKKDLKEIGATGSGQK
ncbi:MAG: HEAT repeat domain-containing protein [Planctomycetota bacterium]